MIQNPTPSELQSFRVTTGLTQAASAKLIHISDRQWRNYEAGTQVMPKAYWELLLIKTKTTGSAVVE